MSELAPLASPAALYSNDLSDTSRIVSKAASLSRKQKAAIIVRLLANEGADVPLSQLDDELQTKLMHQMGKMRYVDRATLADVVSEFAEELDSIGLSFPGGLAGALSALDGKISPQTAARLRKEAGVRQSGDPWERVCALDVARLKVFIRNEATEVSAVLLSKLDTAKAAALLSDLPGPEARRITYAVSHTKSVTPEAVDRIGISLASQLDRDPERAFDADPTKRVGAILNFSPSSTRDDVLTGLEEQDEDFANEVRKSIFTFANIPERVNPVDAGTILREVDQGQLVIALAYAERNGMDDIVSHLLDNISKRLAEGLREEISEAGKIKVKDGEDAQGELVRVIRTLEEAGTITLTVPGEEDEE